MTPIQPGSAFARILFCLTLGVLGSLHATPIGEFAQATDVGKIALPGSSEFIPATGTYRITGSGANMWSKEDAFQFLHKKLSGDLSFTMDVAWPAEGKEAHRKACAIIRAGLEADDVYVDVAVHGDGLIELQDRKTKGTDTIGIRTPILAPATVKLERDGDVFTVSASKNGGPFNPVGAISLAIPDPVFVGLGVCAHNGKNSETALISNVVLKNRGAKEADDSIEEATTVSTALLNDEPVASSNSNKSVNVPPTSTPKR